jgi:P pilus assembly chaperone PapD
MADRLRIELRETELAASPGHPAATACTVYNQSLIVDEYRLTVTGIDPAWVKLDPVTSRIFPSATASLPLAFDPPLTAPAGAHPFELVATSVDDPTLTASVQGVLTVGPYLAFSLDLDSPRLVTNDAEGVYALTVTNAGNARLTVQVEAADEADQVSCAFDQPRVTLGPHEKRQVRLTARPRRADLGGRGASHEIVVTARVVEVVPAMDPASFPAPRQTTVTLQLAPSREPPLRLQPRRVELAGTAAETDVVLTNPLGVPLTMALSASDQAEILAFAFGGGPWRTVAPGESVAVPLRITCLHPHRLAPLPGATGFTVTATPINPEGAPQSVPGELTLPPPADVRVRLDPERVELAGNAAQTEVVLTNQGSSPVEVALEATDRARALHFDLGGSERVAVGPRQTLRVPLHATLAERKPGAAVAGTMPFTVTATPVDPVGEARTATGEIATPGPPGFRAWLEPERIESGGPDRVRLLVENVSHQAAAFVIAGRSRDAGLTVAVNPARVEVAPHDQTEVTIELTPRAGTTAAPREGPSISRYAVRVAPENAPQASSEVTGEFVLLPAQVRVRLAQRRVVAPGPATFDVQLTNLGTADVTVALAATDEAEACAFAFDRTELRLGPEGRAQARLTVTPPPADRVDAQWPFEVQARPVWPPGPIVRDQGLLIYRPPEVELHLTPAEQRGRGPRPYTVVVGNPGATPTTVRLDAYGDAGELALHWPMGDTVDLAPGAQTQVPLRVGPLSTAAKRGNGPRALPFSVTATPISPPGMTVTTEARLIALPPRGIPRILWAIPFIVLLGGGAWFAANAIDFGGGDNDPTPTAEATAPPTEDTGIIDSDGDGLSDEEEANFGTNLNDPDSDDDRVSDGDEVRLGTIPTDSDSDHDGLGDGDEIELHTDPLAADSDEDGLSDTQEVREFGTDPNDPNTDDDSMDDGDEVEIGRTPTVPDDPTTS